MYYLNSRYYNPEWGRYLNTDAVAGKTGLLLSHNLFAYSMNNPINMEDPNAYWPSWLRKAAAAVKRVFNSIVRAVTKVVAAVKKAVSNPYIKNTASESINQSAGHIANKSIKKTISGWKSYGTLAISSAVKKPATFTGNIISHVAPHTGTGIFALVDVIEDTRERNYFNLTVDVGSVAASEGIGIMATRAIGTGIIAVLLPEVGVGVISIGASIGISIGIDMLGNRIKESHYGSD